MSGIPHKKKGDTRGLFIDASCITPNSTSKLINDYGLKHDPFLMGIVRNSQYDGNYWHRFTVFNESYSLQQYDKNYILKVITDFIYPADLLPVYFSQKATKSFFLSRNCPEAIIKLCEEGLTVPNPDKPELPFKMIIIKDVLTIQQVPIVNVEPNIKDVLRRRLKYKTLNLEQFHEDKELKEFCPLAQPKLLLYVLHLASKMCFTRLVLCNNDIKTLPSLDLLHDCPVESIDLRNNKIQNIEDIRSLEVFKQLESLSLAHNPLCCRFDNGTTYFLYLKTIFRNLHTVDNKIIVEHGFFSKHKTYLCTPKGFDFANQFVEEYFTFYDEVGRPNLAPFYSETCLFSLTFRVLPTENMQFVNKRTSQDFKQLDNNLLKSTIIRRGKVHEGVENIMFIFQRLRPTIHNPSTFNVDLMDYTNSRAVIVVTGVFRIPPQSNFLAFKGVCYTFTRTFVLSSKDGKEWLIKNDQYHINYSPANLGDLPGFPTAYDPTTFPEPTNNNNKHDLVQTLESITGMTYDSCKRFFQKNDWNIELALGVFLDEYINNEIPDDAFKELSINEEVTNDSDDDSVIITEDDILPPIEYLTQKEVVPIMIQQKSNSDVNLLPSQPASSISSITQSNVVTSSGIEIRKKRGRKKDQYMRRKKRAKKMISLNSTPELNN